MYKVVYKNEVVNLGASSNEKMYKDLGVGTIFRDIDNSKYLLYLKINRRSSVEINGGIITSFEPNQSVEAYTGDIVLDDRYFYDRKKIDRF